MLLRTFTKTKDTSPIAFITGQLIVFTGVGAVGTATQYLILIALVQLLKMYPVIASAIGFSAGAITNYLLNYYITFKSVSRHKIAMLRFFSIALIGLLGNTIIMSFTMKWFHLNYLIAQLFATGLILIWNFAANRIWTF